MLKPLAETPLAAAHRAVLSSVGHAPPPAAAAAAAAVGGGGGGGKSSIGGMTAGAAAGLATGAAAAGVAGRVGGDGVLRGAEELGRGKGQAQVAAGAFSGLRRPHQEQQQEQQQQRGRCRQQSKAGAGVLESLSSPAAKAGANEKAKGFENKAGSAFRSWATKNDFHACGQQQYQQRGARVPGSTSRPPQSAYSSTEYALTPLTPSSAVVDPQDFRRRAQYFSGGHEQQVATAGDGPAASADVAAAVAAADKAVQMLQHMAVEGPWRNQQRQKVQVKGTSTLIRAAADAIALGGAIAVAMPRVKVVNAAGVSSVGPSPPAAPPAMSGGAGLKSGVHMVCGGLILLPERRLSPRRKVQQLQATLQQQKQERQQQPRWKWSKNCNHAQEQQFQQEASCSTLAQVPEGRAIAASAAHAERQAMLVEQAATQTATAAAAIAAAQKAMESTVVSGGPAVLVKLDAVGMAQGQPASVKEYLQDLNLQQVCQESMQQQSTMCMPQTLGETVPYPSDTNCDQHSVLKQML